MKTVKVSDLQEQTGLPGTGRAILKCFICGEENSANKGDYFTLAKNHVFTCCEEPMSLVMKRVVYEEI